MNYDVKAENNYFGQKKEKYVKNAKSWANSKPGELFNHVIKGAHTLQGVPLQPQDTLT